MSTSVAILYALSFGASVLQVLYLPLLSTYAAEIGLRTYEIGLIAGLGAIVYTITSPFSGSISSRLGERRAIALALLLLAASYASMLLARNFALLALLAGLSLASYAIFWPAVEAGIAYYGGVPSTFSASWSGGTLVGAILASPVLEAPRALAFLSAASLSAALSILSAFMRDSPRAVSTVGLLEIVEGVRRLHREWRLSFAYASSLGSILAFYPLLIDSYGLPAWFTSLTFFSMVGARTLVFLVYDKLPEWARRRSIGIVLLSTAFTLPFLKREFTVTAVSSLTGFGQGILYSTSLKRALSSRDESRVYTGLFEGSIGLGYAVGPAAAGLVASYSLLYAIPTATLISVIVAVIP